MAAGDTQLFTLRFTVVPTPNSDGDVTQLLKAMQAGDPDAGEKLLPLVYDELHRLARNYMRRERPDHTLQPTALINEAYMRLARGPADWQNRSHFIAVAANVMRRILVDHARAHTAAARGGKQQQVEWNDAFGLPEERSRDLVALDDALLQLEAIHPRQAKIVEMHYIVGLTYEEIAAVLAISERTVKRDWVLARGWLFECLSSEKTRE